MVSAQFEATDDPLEKITTAEAIRTLIEYYHTSQYYYAAREKVQEISKVVSWSLAAWFFMGICGKHCSDIGMLYWELDFFAHDTERNCSGFRR